MRWYAAHAILYLKKKKKRRAKNPIPVWENIILVKARGGVSAARTAARLSRQQEGDYGDAGTLVFAGIRKVLLTFVGAPSNGEEVSWLELTAKDLKTVHALAAGKKVGLVHDSIDWEYSPGSSRRKRPNL